MCVQNFHTKLTKPFLFPSSWFPVLIALLGPSPIRMFVLDPGMAAQNLLTALHLWPNFGEVEVRLDLT